MSQVLLLLLLISFSQPILAQEDIGELESLEQELEALESEDIGEVPEFSEAAPPASNDFDNLEELDSEANELVEDLDAQKTVETPSIPEEETLNEKDLLLEEGDTGFEKAENQVEDPFSDDTFNEEENVEAIVEEDFVAPEASDVAEETPAVPTSPVLAPNEEKSEDKDIAEEETIAPTQEELVTEEPSVVEESIEVAREAKPDMPNSKKEREIYNAYQYIKNNNNSINDWSVVSDGRESESYMIQGGDSLWDISTTLFGNPYFWPKIWSLNSSITNPHSIRPNTNLVFVEGSSEQVPLLTEEGDVEATVTEVEASEDNLLVEDLPDLPKAEKNRPTLQKVPPSLGVWDALPDEEDFAIGKISKVAGNLSNFVKVSHYLASDVPASEGEIVEIEGSLNAANLYQYVYIQSETLNVGDRILAFMVGNKLKSIKGKDIGYPVDNLGELRIVESVSAKKRMLKAIVEGLVSPVKIKAKVAKSKFPIVTINDLAPVSNVRANVVGGRFDDRRKVFATNSYIYLDQGANAGLAVGNKLQILKNHKARHKDSLVESNTNVIGLAYVVDVKADTATAVVMDSDDQITVGDITGSAEVVSFGSEPELEFGEGQNDNSESLEDDLLDAPSDDADSDFL